MMVLKFSALWLALLCCNFSLLQSPVFGLQDNPFGENPTNERLDPFASATVDNNPFAVKSTAPEKEKTHEQSEQIHAELKFLQQKLRHLTRDNNHLKQSLDTYITLATRNSELHQRLLERMVRSEDENTRMIGLVEMQSQQLSESGVQAVVDLVKSGSAKEKQLAVQWLTNSQPADIARKMGYQKPGRWYSSDVNENYLSIAKALDEKCSFDFDEVCLEEFANDIRERCKINVVMGEGVDKALPITFTVSGVSLETGLKRLLIKHELDYQVTDDLITFVKKGTPEPPTTKVYLLKGLLGDDLPVEKVIEILTKLHDDNVALVSAVGKERIVIKAPESAQRGISKLLGQLAINQ